MVGGREGGHRDDPYSIAAPGADAPLRLSHGTTTVALVFEGGVIAAVDSRASMGSFVGSRTTQKVWVEWLRAAVLRGGLLGACLLNTAYC